jgi:hypothetical protein
MSSRRIPSVFLRRCLLDGDGTAPTESVVIDREVEVAQALGVRGCVHLYDTWTDDSETRDRERSATEDAVGVRSIIGAVSIGGLIMMIAA